MITTERSGRCGAPWSAARNHYGSHSKRGAEAAALFYTQFESAELAGIDPRHYVLEATRRAIASPGAITLPRDVT